MSRRKPPVCLHQEITLTLTGQSHTGDGVGKYEGFAVFVPGGIAGDGSRQSDESQADLRPCPHRSHFERKSGPGDTAVSDFRPLRRLSIATPGVRRPVKDESPPRAGQPRAHRSIERGLGLTMRNCSSISCSRPVNLRADSNFKLRLALPSSVLRYPRYSSVTLMPYLPVRAASFTFA